MKKYELYRTAVDALHFLVSSELGFSENELLVLENLLQYVYDEMKDEIHDIVSKQIGK